jgi:hypothetical protein
MHLVKLYYGNEGRHPDLTQAVGAIPLQEISGACELIWSPHDGVDRRGHVLDRLCQRFRIRRHPTEMAPIQQLHCPKILRMTVVLGRFVAHQDCLGLFRELPSRGIHPRDTLPGACRTGCQDQAAQVLTVV